MFEDNLIILNRYFKTLKHLKLLYSSGFSFLVTFNFIPYLPWRISQLQSSKSPWLLPAFCRRWEKLGEKRPRGPPCGAGHLKKYTCFTPSKKVPAPKGLSCVAGSRYCSRWMFCFFLEVALQGVYRVFGVSHLESSCLIRTFGYML